MLVRIFPVIIMLFISSSCIISSDSPVESSSDDVNLIQVGDIIVTNSGNDSIVLLNEDGSFKFTLVDSNTSATLIYNGLAFDELNREVLYAHDSTVAGQDAVMSISLYDGSVSTVITNAQLNGTMPGLARLTGGELLVLEGTNAAEKFSATGLRIGAPFISGLIANVADTTRLINGGFIVCSSATANTVRTYNSTGTLQSTATSANPLPTLGALASTSCTQANDGTIYVAYSGGTDAVRAYNSTLTTVLWTFTDTNVLTTPGKLAIRPNGNILVTDTGFHHIVEIDTNGAFVGVIGGAGLNNPNNIIVVK